MGEHALELETANVRLERHGLGLDVLGGRFVVFAFREIQQLAGVGNALGGFVDFLDRRGEPGALLT
jgi:hypothetical protein